MDAAAFVDKWRMSGRSERSASQEHFLDLRELLHHPKPGAADPKGLVFTTERRVKKEGGKWGFADVWKKGFFAWEYKKKGADLEAAYNQLLQYSGDLGNPPLLVVSDMDQIEIRTRFTGYPTDRHLITLDTLTAPENLEKLRCVAADHHCPRGHNACTSPKHVMISAASSHVPQRRPDRAPLHDPRCGQPSIPAGANA